MDVHRYSSLLLFLGLVWGKSLKFVNSDGESGIVNESKFGLHFYSSLFYLNGTRYIIKKIDFRTKLIKVQKRGFLKFEEVPFDSIYSFRYVERNFNIIPMLIGGVIGYYDMKKPNTDFLSFTFRTIPIFGLGFGLSFLPQFSEELIVGDDGWSIKIN